MYRARDANASLDGAGNRAANPILHCLTDNEAAQTQTTCHLGLENQNIGGLGIQHAPDAFQVAHRFIRRDWYCHSLTEIAHPAQIIGSKRLLDVLDLLPGTALQDCTRCLEAPALICVQPKRNLWPDRLSDRCDALNIFLLPLSN